MKTKESKLRFLLVRHGVLETDSLESEITPEYRLHMVCHYINTEKNIADLITKDLPYNEYLSELKHWVAGSSW